jgi:prevent-host-death family protein
MSAHAPFDKPVTIHDAKTNLSRLVAEAEAGREIILARGSKPVAKIVPLKPKLSEKRQLGWLRNDSKGSDPLAYGFWDPLPDDELELWNGESLPADPLFQPPKE